MYKYPICPYCEEQMEMFSEPEKSKERYVCNKCKVLVTIHDLDKLLNKLLRMI